jgi:hypothetical protein
MANSATDVLLFTGASGDFDWDTSGNWTTIQGSPAAGTPSTGEGVAFNELSATNLTVPPGSSVAINNFRVAPGCRINFGSASTAIDNVAVTSGTTPKMIYGGDCPAFYFNGSITTASINRTGGGEFVYVGGTLTNGTFQSGKVTIGGGATTTTGYLTGADVLQLADSGSAATTLYVVSGSYTTDRDYVTLHQSGGHVVTRGTAKASTSHNLYGGTFDVQSSGTIAQILGFGGKLSLVKAQRPLTITTLVENTKPGAFNFDEESAGTVVTITTRTKIGSKM